MTRFPTDYTAVLRALEEWATPGAVPYAFPVDADDCELRNIAWATCPVCGSPRLKVEDIDGAAAVTCQAGCPSTQVRALLVPRYKEDRTQQCDTSVAANPGPRPGPCNAAEDQRSGGPEGEEPEMRMLLALYVRGEIEPEPVRLGALPDDASAAMCGIARDMALRIGLRRTVDDHRPLPYATGEAVRAGICRFRMQASRAIDLLVLAGVIENAGSMPPRPGGPPNGTKLYVPPGQGPRP